MSTSRACFSWKSLPQVVSLQNSLPQAQQSQKLLDAGERQIVDGGQMDINGAIDGQPLEGSRGCAEQQEKTITGLLIKTEQITL